MYIKTHRHFDISDYVDTICTALGILCPWKPNSEKGEREREKRKETWQSNADLEVGTILSWRLLFFPPLSLFLVWRKLSSWALAVWFLLRLSTTLPPILHYGVWFNCRRGWAGEVEERGSFCKALLNLDMQFQSIHVDQENLSDLCTWADISIWPSASFWRHRHTQISVCSYHRISLTFRRRFCRCFIFSSCKCYPCECVKFL